MIGAIVDRLKDGVPDVQHTTVQALVELAKFGKMFHWLMTSKANCILDDIRTKVTTPEVICVIVDRHGDGDPNVRHSTVQTLIELAKFGECVHCMMTCTS